MCITKPNKASFSLRPRIGISLIWLSLTLHETEKSPVCLYHHELERLELASRIQDGGIQERYIRQDEEEGKEEWERKKWS